MVLSLVEVWAWYALPDEQYNALWSLCDLVYAWFEVALACELTCNLWTRWRASYALLLTVIFVHFNVLWSEWRSWLAFMNGDGWWLYNLREWCNLAVILIALWCVTVNRKRNCAMETLCTIRSRGSRR